MTQVGGGLIVNRKLNRGLLLSLAIDQTLPCNCLLVSFNDDDTSFFPLRGLLFFYPQITLRVQFSPIAAIAFIFK